MTVEECYSSLEGDYKQALLRLHSDKIIKKFMMKFPGQCGYDMLCQAMDEKDYGAAFSAAHTLKGVCMNLDFTKLKESSSKLTEALRNGYSDDVPGLFMQVKDDYRQTVEAINRLEE